MDNIIRQDKISIILPTYNGAKYLKRAIDSCLNQTYRNIELIIIDDCSTDDTPLIARSVSDPRVRYFRNETNQRLPKSLNIGFAKATGEYLTWTSDDNEFYPQALEVMLDRLKKDLSVDFVYADYLSKYLETGETSERRFAGKTLKDKNCVGACFLYKRQVYDFIGGFDPKYELVEDYEYWIRVSKKFRLKHIPEILYIYGEHRQSLTGSRIATIDLLAKVLKYRHGFIPLSQLMEQLEQFLSVSIDCRKSTAQLASLWRNTMRQMCNVSFFFGALFLFYSLYLFIVRMAGYTVKKILWPVRKSAVESKIKRLAPTLRLQKGKINILCPVSSMRLGGSQKVSLSIAQGLKGRDGLCFHLLTTKSKDQVWKEVFSATFENVILIDPVPDEKLYLNYYTSIIESLNIDILLISHSRSAYACVPELKRRFKNLKVVDILHLERVVPARNEMLWVTPYMDKRVCISDNLRKHMVAKYQISGMDSSFADRMATIYNGIDLDHFKRGEELKGRFKSKYRLAQDVKLVSFIARFSVEKNPLLFVDVARDIIKNTPAAGLKFVMAGDGYLFDQAKKQISSYGLGDHFILTGMLEDIQELLADTYLLLFVSENEGIPLTITEALAMDVPVISTVVGGIDEVLKNDFNGYLVSWEEDVKARFVFLTLKLLGDSSLYASLSRNARSGFLLEEFSQEHMCRRYSQIFHALKASDPVLEGRLK